MTYVVYYNILTASNMLWSHIVYAGNSYADAKMKFDFFKVPDHFTPVYAEVRLEEWVNGLLIDADTKVLVDTMKDEGSN